MGFGSSHYNTFMLHYITFLLIKLTALATTGMVATEASVRK